MITEALENTLRKQDLSLEDFSELLVRLLHYGVLSRYHNSTEQVLYDRYLRIHRLVDEYLDIIHIRVFHDEKFQYIRLYPPGSNVPGQESHESYTSGFRLKLKQDEVAVILILRIQYDKAIREGRVSVDEYGYVTERLEVVSIAMKEILDRSLPENLTARRELFTKLKQLRLIEFNKDTIDNLQEALLKISPSILSFVNDDALAALESAQQAEEVQHVS
jgi:hypothetical protein